MRIESMDATRLIDRAVERPPEPVIMSQKTSQAPVEEKAIHEDSQGTHISEKILIDAIEKANKAMVSANRALEFSIHEKTKEIIVKVVDTESKEVIREIPSEKILDMVANMLEMAGILVDERR